MILPDSARSQSPAFAHCVAKPTLEIESTFTSWPSWSGSPFQTPIAREGPSVRSHFNGSFASVTSIAAPSHGAQEGRMSAYENGESALDGTAANTSHAESERTATQFKVRMKYPPASFIERCHGRSLPFELLWF